MPATKRPKPLPPPTKPATATEAAPPALATTPDAPALAVYRGDRIALAVWLTGAILIIGLLLKDLAVSLFRLLLP
jgi:hypothetical protein